MWLFLTSAFKVGACLLMKSKLISATAIPSKLSYADAVVLLCCSQFKTDFMESCNADFSCHVWEDPSSY